MFDFKNLGIFFKKKKKILTLTKRVGVLLDEGKWIVETSSFTLATLFLEDPPSWSQVDVGVSERSDDRRGTTCS